MIHTQVLINLQPPQEAHHISHNSNYIYHREGKRMIRKIFYNVDYDDFESEKILELERVIKSQQLDLPSSWDRANTLKYCYYGQFNIKKSINGVKQHLDWLREKKWHKLTPQALEYLKQGLIYQYGFDKQLRPLIFLDFSKFDYNEINIDDFMIAAIFVFDKAKKYSFIPGKIENWIIFLDLKGVQIQDLPYNIIKKSISMLSVNFTCCMEKTFVLFPPSFFKIVWNVVKPILHPDTASKITFFPVEEVFLVQQDISQDQLQKKYGGSLQNLVEFWQILLKRQQFKASIIQFVKKTSGECIT